MAFGKMNAFITVVANTAGKDDEGFATEGESVLASVRAYKEIRNSSARWERMAGNAAFAEVAAMFRFRKIPGLDITPAHFIVEGGSRYNIVLVDDVRGRGMYVEAWTEKLEGSVR